jgi:hypothetical protein
MSWNRHQMFEHFRIQLLVERDETERKMSDKVQLQGAIEVVQ